MGNAISHNDNTHTHITMMSLVFLVMLLQLVLCMLMGVRKVCIVGNVVGTRGVDGCYCVIVAIVDVCICVGVVIVDVVDAMRVGIGVVAYDVVVVC